ncbi:ion transporter [Enterocloster citroniae]|uniref:Ion transport domain-containing protein n=1 Tax=[Clostridium] citroniae WAL-17108 TaxID=742733 RepID=G5HEN0_9FIRM|nr:ion transporter [Enterocloster citroniae]EHE99988.1 hypothetical protein HMPREF9469_00903 [ [[Clostridium] citroniae WAL-17108]MCC3383251.1 ion transporter [Enterocloster citroniae]
MKKRIFEIIQSANTGDIASKIFDLFIMLLVIINSITIMIDTFSLPQNFKTTIRIIDTSTSIIFSIEYALRIWTAPFLFPNKSNTKARIRYIFSFMAIIDLLAILPFYLPMLIPFNLKSLRLLRLTRLLRIFKMNRYTNALYKVGAVFKAKASQLISSMLVVVMLIILSSILMFNIENTAQPEAFTNIFDSMWWAVATFTTVGYGDIYPITVAGKLLSTIIAFLGIGLVAVPTGIISAGFVEQIDKHDDDKKHYCPYCGKRLD